MKGKKKRKKEWKDNAQSGGKTSVTRISDKGLVSRLYKILLKLIIKTTNLISKLENGQKTQIDISP